MTYSNCLREILLFEMKNGLLSVERDTFLLLIRYLSLIPLTDLRNVFINNYKYFFFIFDHLFIVNWNKF
jgi:hypothetical protein